MKFVLAGATLAVVLAMALTPAGARNEKRWIEQNIGQEVFDLQGVRVGRIERFIDVRGTPGVLIAGGNDLGGRTLIMPSENLTMRDGGGLMVMMKRAQIARMAPYQPGRLPYF
jgi:hypothetical protein